MISLLLQKIIGDLINAKDGTISLTRLATCTAQAFAALFFFAYNVRDVVSGAAPNFELWTVYLSITVLHASYDKTLMVTKGKALNDIKPDTK